MRHIEGETDLVLTPLRETFSTEGLKFCLNQENCRWIYYLDRNDFSVVWQFDPVKQEKRKLIRADNFPADSVFFWDIFWANDRYLILGSSDEEQEHLALHFVEIKDGHLCSLGLLQHEINPQHLSVLPKQKMLLFRNVNSELITLWTIKSGESWVTQIKINPEMDTAAFSQKTEEFHEAVIPRASAVSALQFIDEKAFIVITCTGKTKIIRWNIVEAGVEKAWEFSENDWGFLGLDGRFSPDQISVHSDRIIFIQDCRMLSLCIESKTLLNLDLFPEIKTPGIKKLRKISDNHILFRVYANSFSMGIYNIRTQKCEHYFPFEELNAKIPEKYVFLSPTVFLSSHYHSTKIILWRAEKGTISRQLFYQQEDRIYGRVDLIPLRGGHVFVLRNESEDPNKLLGSSCGNDAVLISDKKYSNPIEANTLTRAYAAICFARIINKEKFPADIARHILSFMCSGYETPAQLKKIRFFCLQLLGRARKVAAQDSTPQPNHSVPQIKS